MGNSIPLSNKHGLNPSLSLCFWCGEEKNEVLLLGRLPNDAEAPRHTIANYDPCDACKGLMEQGITFLEATEIPQYPNQMEMGAQGGRKAYPTGAFMVVKEEAARRFLRDGAHLSEVEVEDTIRGKFVYLDSQSFTRAFRPEEEREFLEEK